MIASTVKRGRPFGDAHWWDWSLARRVVAEYPQRTIGAAPRFISERGSTLLIPGLIRLGHYADWLEWNATSFIRAKERLDEK